VNFGHTDIWVVDPGTNIAIPLAVQANFELGIDATAIEQPDGNSSGILSIQTAQPISVSFEWAVSRAGLWKVLLGATTAAPTVSIPGYVRKRESGVVAAATYEIELSDTLDFLSGSDIPIVVQPSGGQPLTPVVGVSTPAADEVLVADADATLTFNSTREGETMDIIWWTKETTGTSPRVVIMPPDALVQTLRFLFWVRGHDHYLGSGDNGVVINLNKVVRTGTLRLFGSAVNELGFHTFEGRAENSVSGDFSWYSPPVSGD
jgi:hypothetical protein